MMAMKMNKCLLGMSSIRTRPFILATILVCASIRFPLAPNLRELVVTADSIFSGITTFAKLPWVQCLGKHKNEPFDIAFLGAPFDTGTSYRPGARFGPAGIRAGSRRLTLYGGYNVPLEVNPFMSGLRIVDCGDIPVTPYDNKYAIKQIEDGHKDLLHRIPFSLLGNDSTTGKPLSPISKDGKHHPRIITLGGDHTIVLPLLRSINSAYGEISVIHFDSHLDTWKPSVFGGAPSHQAEINHGTYFYWASQEGLIKNGSSIASASASISTPISPSSVMFKRFDPSLLHFDSMGPSGQLCPDLPTTITTTFRGSNESKLVK